MRYNGRAFARYEMELIAYLRVSTREQGASGLGLDAQRDKVSQLAEARGATVVAEFVEIESGRKNHRPVLAQALAEARKRKAAIAVAKLDRLARDAEFVLRLSREAEANGLAGFLFADLPDIDATTSAGRMVLTVMASVAEFEARRISERTKEALAAAKAQGKRLGSHNPNNAAANAARAQLASEKAQKLRGLLLPMREQGMTLQAIADALNSSGQPTPSGAGQWQAMTVRRALQRLQHA